MMSNYPGALAILLAGMCAGQGRAAESWPGVEYAEVRAFAWPADHLGAVLSPGGKMAPGAIPAKGKPLSKLQTQRLLKAESRRYTARPLAGCYEPHNGFVFYDRERKPVAYLEICFDCLGARTWPADAEADPDYILLGELCAELKLPFGRFKSMEALRREVAPILSATP